MHTPSASKEKTWPLAILSGDPPFSILRGSLISSLLAPSIGDTSHHEIYKLNEYSDIKMVDVPSRLNRKGTCHSLKGLKSEILLHCSFQTRYISRFWTLISNMNVFETRKVFYSLQRVNWPSHNKWQSNK